MTEALPKFIQPVHMAERGTQLIGQLPVTVLIRLSSFLKDKEGQVAVELNCSLDEENLPYIKGKLDVSLHLECQRCLKAMDYPLHVAVSLSPVFSEKAGGQLPERYEPLVLEEDKLLLSTLVEDELLLNLPMAPRHESCGEKPKNYG